MGRHTADDAADGDHPSRRTPWRLRPVPVRRPRALRGPVPLRLAIGGVVVVGALAAGTALAGVDGREGWWAASNAAGTGDVASASDGSRQGSGGSQDEECRQTEDVWVVAGDGLVSALEGLDPAALGPDADGVCAALRVVGETEVATAASLASGLDSPRRADVWVPDSSLWVDRARAEGVQVEAVASLGTSPVVVASSPEALSAAGWDAAAPTWGDVLGGELPIAVPSLEDSSSAVLALAASRSGAAGPEAGMLTVRTVLARQQIGTLSPSEGLARAAGGGADAPLVLTSEQDVLRLTAGAETTLLQAVSPRDGTPVLDYPVLAVPSVGEREPADAAAVGMVLDALTGPAGRAAGAAAGLRGPDLVPVQGAVPLVEVAGPLVYPDADAIAAVVADLQRLAPATKLLVVVDVSLSMSAPVGDGFTRADVAAEALSRGLGDLPTQTLVSLWVFASSLQPGLDHVEVLPSRRLDALVDGRTQRELLGDAVAGLPASLVDGGTSLYDTTDAAMTAAREQYDPGTVSTVLLITDGRNEDSTGLDLPAVTARLAGQADPARPVSLVAVAFGPDADLAALEQLAAAAGPTSQARAARNPEALRSLIVELLAARTQSPLPAP